MMNDTFYAHKIFKLIEEYVTKMAFWAAENGEEITENHNREAFREILQDEWNEYKDDVYDDVFTILKEFDLMDEEDDQDDEDDELNDEDTCCFCGAPLQKWDEGFYGNNPDPADTRPNKRCCDACNSKIVIPSRLYISNLINQNKKED